MDDKLTEKIYVDEESERLIRYNFLQYRVMAVVWIAISISSCIISLIRIIKYRHYPVNEWFDQFNIKVYPALFLITTIISVFQLYNYYSAIKYQNRAITESDQQLFSKSFRFYRTGNTLSIILLCITLLSDLVLLLQEFLVPASI